ncbi:hypothetical protein BaRGS_00028036 [Batillaria attramentaria]|uniref:Uncharacterized protein n=1 Tax=Batillaria attramentaria TaxID=370345 RepID=A0ABD0K131_9CAEN
MLAGSSFKRDWKLQTQSLPACRKFPPLAALPVSRCAKPRVSQQPFASTVCVCRRDRSGACRMFGCQNRQIASFQHTKPKPAEAAGKERKKLCRRAEIPPHIAAPLTGKCAGPGQVKPQLADSLYQLSELMGCHLLSLSHITRFESSLYSTADGSCAKALLEFSWPAQIKRTPQRIAEKHLI